MKINIEINTPGNGKTYEFSLDNTMTVRQAKEKIADEILKFENYNISLSLNKLILFNKTNKSICDDNEYLISAGIKSGHTLVLI